MRLFCHVPQMMLIRRVVLTVTLLALVLSSGSACARRPAWHAASAPMRVHLTAEISADSSPAVAYMRAVVAKNVSLPHGTLLRWVHEYEGTATETISLAPPIRPAAPYGSAPRFFRVAPLSGAGLHRVHVIVELPSKKLSSNTVEIRLP